MPFWKRLGKKINQNPTQKNDILSPKVEIKIEKSTDF